MIAAPAYRRLVAAEPFLRRAIPALIVLFLLIVAATRFIALMNAHDSIDRNTKATLALAASQLAGVASVNDPKKSGRGNGDLVRQTADFAAFGDGYVLALTDGDFRIVAVTSSGQGWLGKSLQALVYGGQPLSFSGNGPA
jgi:two-component system cell cycle sensor histidine kinase PleC